MLQQHLKATVRLVVSGIVQTLATSIYLAFMQGFATGDLKAHCKSCIVILILQTVVGIERETTISKISKEVSVLTRNII